MRVIFLGLFMARSCVRKRKYSMDDVQVFESAEMLQRIMPKVPVENIVKFIRYFPNRIYKTAGCCAVFGKLNDETLDMIRRGEFIFDSPDKVCSVFRQEGNNIHIFCVYGNFKELLGIRDFVKGYNVSWKLRDQKFVFFNRKVV